MVQQVGARNILIVPLVYGNRSIGGIALGNKIAGGYGPEDERRLVMLAAGAAIDLENARLYREEQERRQEAEQRRQVAEGLRDILSILNSNRPLQEVLDYIVAQACRLMGTDAGALYRLEPEGEELVIQAHQGMPEGYAEEVTIPVGRGAVGRAALLRQPVAIDDVPLSMAEDPVVFSGPRRKHLARLANRYKSLLAVPLVVKDQVYGGIVLYYPSKRAFGDEEVALAATFGDQAALAIENARLRAQAEQAAVAAERSRLARDLHDAVTQTLFSSSLIAEVLPRLWERSPEEGRRRLEELRQLTRGALAEMRTLLLELRPSALTEAALPDLLRQLAEALTGRARVPASVSVQGERELSADVQIALYRIAQEALNNVAKHSGATKATIQLKADESGVELVIVDDGRGFEPDQVGPDHLGLGIMRERADAIGASVNIDSQPGNGTRVVAVWRDSNAE
jgi:signal transduction histidine kinase